jgi:hypothetical protein
LLKIEEGPFWEGRERLLTCQQLQSLHRF